MHVNEKVPAPSTLISGVPASLDALIVRATSTNPDDRPRDAGELLEQLRAIQIELDPRRSQLSLELDLPPIAIREKSRNAKRVLPPQKSTSSGTVLPMKSSGDKNPKEKSTQTARDKRRKASARVRRNRWIAALSVIAVAGGIWYAFAGGGNKILVQSVVGQTVTQANSLLQPLGLHTKVAQQVFSEIVDQGKIISSDPSGGGRISPGGTVSLVVSKGPERFAVPSLIGLTADAALTLLQKNSLVDGTMSDAFSATVPQGMIISSSPTAGASVARGTSVNFIVSKGPELLVLNSYVGKSGDQALTELTNAGFVVSTTYAYSDIVAVGAVMSQNPDGTGGTAPKGTKVALIVSQGSESVFVPNVYSFTQAKAAAMLQDLDLLVSVKKIGTRAVKTVTDISPTVGTKVKRGSTVVITVG